jgi:hypothetical protein
MTTTPNPAELPSRPLTLTIELEADPLNDLLAARLTILTLGELWAHGTQGKIHISEPPPPPCTRHHKPTY